MQTVDRARVEAIFADPNASAADLFAHADGFMQHIKKNADPLVRPGQLEKFTEAAAPNDYIRQGDVYIIVKEGVPKKGYNKIQLAEKTADKLQVVPGSTKGAKHILDSWDGVEMFRPKDWSEDGFKGPYLVLSENRLLKHDEHGDVQLLAGQTYCIGYQREKDAMDAAERRRLD